MAAKRTAVMPRLNDAGILRGRIRQVQGYISCHRVRELPQISDSGSTMGSRGIAGEFEFCVLNGISRRSKKGAEPRNQPSSVADSHNGISIVKGQMK